MRTKTALPFDFALEFIDKNPTYSYDAKEKNPDEELRLDLFTKVPYNIRLIDFLSRSVGLFGMTGSGKSMAVARLMEEISSHKIPFTLFDKVGDFDSLTDYDPNIKVYFFREYLDNDTIYYRTKTSWFGKISLSEEKIITMNEIVELARKNYLEGKMTVMVLAGLMERETRINFVYRYTTEIYEMANKLYLSQVEKGIKKTIFHLILLDECHNFLVPAYSVYYDKDLKVSTIINDNLTGKAKAERISIFKKINTLYAFIASEGRKLGLQLVLASQSMVNVEWSVRSNLSQFFLLRSISSPDLKDYEHYLQSCEVPLRKAQLEAIMPTFQPGELLYVNMGKIFLTKMEKRRTYHPGSTPKPSDTFKTINDIKTGKLRLGIG